MVDILDNVEGKIVRGITTGGKPGNKNAFETEIVLSEVKKPVGDEVGQTWVIIHGNKSSPEGENIAPLIEEITANAAESDRVIALDWSEAAALTGGTLGFAGGNGVSATWIGPTAEETVKILQEEFGIDPDIASQELNLVGHSLGSLVSSEIGQIYKTGSNRAGTSVVDGNGEGVKTITALDPAAETNLVPDFLPGESGYDVDGRVNGRQTPADFNDSAVYSRSFIGAKSFFGNPLFADSADEAYELDFGNLADFGGEHPRVVRSYTNIVSNPGKIGELLGYDSYQSLDSITTEEFEEINVTRRLRPRTYQGVIKVDDANQPTLLTANSAVNDNGKIIIGADRADIIDGDIDNDKLFGDSNNDTLSGKLGNDILVGATGNDRLTGDGLSNIGNDIIYGGTGADTLTGDGGTDTFVYQTGDGNSDRADIITDFEVGVDNIGLIDIDSQEITLEGDSVDSIIKLDGEYLAVIEGVSLDEFDIASQDSAFYDSVDLAIFDIV